MVKLEIVNVEGYLYVLEDTNGNKYRMNLDFWDIEEKPQIGDYMQISAQLLNPKYAGYSSNYTFGDLKSIYGKKNIEIDDIDVIVIEKNKKEIFLKRLYG